MFFDFKFLFLTLIGITSCYANTECFWATGIVKCKNDPSKVVGTIVEVYDLDSPPNVKFLLSLFIKIQMEIRNPLDPDDKAGVTTVEEEDGLFKVDGCASDQDWIPGLKNRPEFYFKIHHYCNSKSGDTKIILPVFRVYTPETYDYHIKNPIYLDE